MTPPCSKVSRKSIEKSLVPRWPQDTLWAVYTVTMHRIRAPNMVLTIGRIICKRILRGFTFKILPSSLQVSHWTAPSLGNTSVESWPKYTSPSSLPSGLMRPPSIKECFISSVAPSTSSNITMRSSGPSLLKTLNKNFGSTTSNFSRPSTRPSHK